MLTKSNHPFHMVDMSPWPIISATGMMILTFGLTKWFNKTDTTLLMLGTSIMILTMIQWWRDVIRESTFQGLHTSLVSKGLRWGMILFIVSEIMFFASFFWSFFNSSLAPTIELGMNWPPVGIQPFSPIQIPLLNTLILLSSGITVTWAHYSLMNSNHSQTTQSLVITVIMGLYFTTLQAYEYWEAPFTISDNMYGSSFFITTGFHGIHVMIGTMFLVTCLTRHINKQLSTNHHFGFEAATWYWHFVDVIWLFLYISVYWWGK
uniref:Cytochrome c oxidase subunit 3 n=1 Tax=Physemacris variolosa TaxID=62778 RepID=E0YCJ2_9ORTH|nr:cytochrome c oxidase subunit III [Physemacris variolosa]ADD97027.1 cytochrome c oxidase subunit III [Physemacris variolosa]